MPANLTITVSGKSSISNTEILKHLNSIFINGGFKKINIKGPPETDTVFWNESNDGFVSDEEVTIIFRE
jgi:hypothetical protein